MGAILNTLNSLSTPVRERRKYLMSCIRVSLFKRWHLLIGAVILGVVMGFSLGFSRLDQVLLGLLCAVLSALLIAVQSWQRHADDVPASRLTLKPPQTQ